MALGKFFETFVIILCFELYEDSSERQRKRLPKMQNSRKDTFSKDTQKEDSYTKQAIKDSRSRPIHTMQEC
nr:unnamed protein product [Callosobruchus chinensis]